MSLPAPIFDGPPTRRSNRPVTQFAVRLLEGFLLGKLDPGDYINHNTRVSYIETKSIGTLAIQLFDDEILNLSIVLETEEPLYLKISVGSSFTSDGRPTRTTAERLNGLLDCLGAHGVLPEGIRIFRTQDEGNLCLGNERTKVLMGRDYAREVLIRPDPDEFTCVSSDIDNKN